MGPALLSRVRDETLCRLPPLIRTTRWAAGITGPGDEIRIAPGDYDPSSGESFPIAFDGQVVRGTGTVQQSTLAGFDPADSVSLNGGEITGMTLEYLLIEVSGSASIHDNIFDGELKLVVREGSPSIVSNHFVARGFADDFLGFPEAVIETRGFSSPDIRSNGFHTASAVLATDASTPTIEDNSLIVEFAGVEVAGAARPRVADNDIQGNDGFPFPVFGSVGTDIAVWGGVAEIEDNVLHDLEYGILVEVGVAVIHKNVIRENGQAIRLGLPEQIPLPFNQKNAVVIARDNVIECSHEGANVHVTLGGSGAVDLGTPLSPGGNSFLNSAQACGVGGGAVNICNHGQAVVTDSGNSHDPFRSFDFTNTDCSSNTDNTAGPVLHF